MSEFDRTLKLYQMMLAYCHKLTEDLDDATLEAEVGSGVNHPLWILGHLAICSDFVLQMLARPTRCPAAWHQQFGPGSDPAQITTPPTKRELLQALTDGHTDVTATLPAASREQLMEPNPIEFLSATLPTKGDLIAHIISTHEAMHLGQLSAWRRHRGLPSVL